MLFSTLLSFGCLALFQASSIAAVSPNDLSFDKKSVLEKRLTYTNVDDYATFQYPIALAGLLANIGPNGAKSSGAKSGVVIASPSTSNPDYLYTWTRDTSLVMKYVVDRYTGGRDSTLRTTIDNWVASSARIQQVTNPSGTVSTGGLGEPKFLISEAAFTG
ncbi:hypothetical protein FRC17_011031, partial [Serendipita sp. 399]